MTQPKKVDTFDHKNVESKLFQKWQQDKIYQTPEIKKKDKKKYILDAFAYPSGSGLHVGHAEGYAGTDILARYWRMKGYKTLYPVGWDSFGLPAEGYAIKTGVHPHESTEKAIENFQKQLKAIGLSNDWEDEFASHREDYYKWTQWWFQFLYKRGLAYKKEAVVNWDPVDKTVLANEQVLPDGTAERSGAVVEQKLMSQWFFKITDYIEDKVVSEGANKGKTMKGLLNGLNDLKWPESTKIQQKNWIGKSTGTIINWKVAAKLPLDKGKNNSKTISTFTTRPDTIYGVTYLVLAPEHELVSELTVKSKKTQVEEYLEAAKKKSQLQRTDLNKDKTGVFTGSYTIHPLTGELVPIWIADYVLSTYGTGAVMAVPAHDERDFEFRERVNARSLNSIYEPRTWKFNFYNQNTDSPLDRILNGRKKVETRALNPEEPDRYFGEIKPGDIAIYRNKETEEEFSYKVSKVFICDSLNEAVEKGLDFTKVGNIEPGYSTEDIVNWYKVNLSEEYFDKIQQNGFVAFEFEKLENSYNPECLNIKQVISTLDFEGELTEALTDKDNTKLIHSGEFNGLSVEEAKNSITEKLIELGAGEFKTTYKLRDWLVSRQRYWGAPIPVIYKPETKYIIFDFDGVLADTWEKHLQAKVNVGWRKDHQEAIDIANKYFNNKPWHSKDKLEHHKNEDDKDFESNTHKHIKNFAAELRRLGINFFDTFLEEIEKIENAKLAVVSGNSKISLETIKSKNSLNFDMLLGYEDAISKEDKINQVCDSWGVDKSQVYYITDTVADVLELENYLKPEQILAVTWGYSGYENLRKYQPEELIIHKPEEFGKFFQSPKPSLVPESDLPVRLPSDVEFHPTGRSPLIDHAGFHSEAEEKYGQGTLREVDTMDTFVCSSWYMFRFCDPHNSEVFADPEKMKNWMPVDKYIIGAEHTVLHLLYARFFTKVLFEAGYIDFDEPFKSLTHPGMIQAEDGRKMSKRWGNVINPIDVIEEYGADTLRMYEMFMGPFEQSKPWNTNTIKGVRRFIDKIWRLTSLLDADNQNQNVESTLHKLIKKAGEDIESMSLNTAVAEFMKFVNVVNEEATITQEQLETFLKVLAPFAPFISEQMWQDLGNTEPVHTQDWPTYNPELLVEDEVTIAIQVNGKVRGEIQVVRDMNESELMNMAKAKVASWLEGKEIKFSKVIPNKLVAIAVK